MSTEPLTTDELRRLRELLDIEAIRKLGVLYSQYLDCDYLEALAELFTEDAVCEFGPYGQWVGRKTIYDNYVAVERTSGPNPGSKPFQAMHANANHWVELTGPDTAVGRRYLLDLLTDRPADQHPFIWLAVYDEAYRKIAGEWKITRSTVQFLWPEKHLTGAFPGVFPPDAQP
ncbi:MAG: nuclear transport factor 2 family protein [Gammaproteobacteria bacterium]